MQEDVIRNRIRRYRHQGVSNVGFVEFGFFRAFRNKYEVRSTKHKAGSLCISLRSPRPPRFKDGGQPSAGSMPLIHRLFDDVGK